ncbi:hypothetical protein [Streptomyces graminilatus]|uniref:hypothetical protein n=1 Tax=Streptomyces graminilatus TaxID=1464070 RepID=UPI0006E40C5E|nr:hypothetical protein [Streptomyces graminilatus]
MTSQIANSMPFAHLTTEHSEAPSEPLPVRRRRSRRQDSLRISALAYEHLSDSGAALEATYQMMRTIQNLLGADDFRRALDFFIAAFGPRTPEQEERNSLFDRTPHREMRAADKHLGEEPSEELSVTYQMMYCIGHMLEDEGLTKFLDFIEAAYIAPMRDMYAA